MATTREGAGPVGAEPLLVAEDIRKHYDVGAHQVLKAVDGVSFEIYRGESVGLAGESGCGKSTCVRCVLGLTQLTDGVVRFKGEDIAGLRGADLMAFRKDAQMVFQDPYASLDPRMTVADIVAEGIDVHGLAKGRAERTELIYRYLRMVGLTEEQAGRFPHEFSGGQRQRVGIARAMAVDPSLLVLDEPISALDVSIQAQIVNLLEDLRDERELSMLFISHDLSMLRYISDRVIVMYLGVVVESAATEELYEHAAHPYTQALLASVPIPDPAAERARVASGTKLTGEVASPIDLPRGCRFAGRCPRATERCRTEEPALREIAPGHLAACHLVS